ncbi:hypothetical protein EYZ11_003862 [Aspergillus tanneri]|uniref:Uncharacterized protein n=1 Tax=Aspergillus tanneri TaxID=1220188 RepID=A0A4S3JPB0_9EURO|nr:uncharacterized protein ATNIH1004_005866 [Aspergillus tanneri]KAA8647176.1 hypothetical protein ATNIH1004_005866 [Aspergillus tanneri]THC96657.1 hypothetical protein EYZ11_003862 [Aspergillus tanneri]
MRISALAVLAWGACVAASPLGGVQHRGLSPHEYACEKPHEMSHPAPAPEPVPYPAPQPAHELAPVPQPEPAPQPAPQPAPEPALQPAPQSAPETAPASALAPGPGQGCDEHSCHGTGHLVQDLGNPTHKLLHVVGIHREELLIKLSLVVEDLLGGLDVHDKLVGYIIKEAPSLAELVADLDDPTKCYLVVLGKNTGYLLVGLDHRVSGLLSEVGLKSIVGPVGQVVGTVGQGGLLEHVAPVDNCLLQIVSEDGKILLVELSGPLAGEVSGLGLGLAKTVGKVVKAAAEVGELVKGLAPVGECLLTIVGNDGKPLLIQLSEAVASRVDKSVFPGLEVPVGKVVKVF